MKLILIFGLLGVGLEVLADSSEYAKPGSKGSKATTCPCGTRKRPKSRIVGGENAGAGEWPMMVGVQEFLPKGVRNCGGTIITKKHVVTAAHCLVHPNMKVGKIELSDPSKMRIIFGVFNKNDVPADNRKEVDMFHVHGKYKVRGLSNDIAVVVIKDTFPLYRNPDVFPACLPVSKYPVPVGSDVIAVGWGLTSWTGPNEYTKSHLLKQVHLKTHDLETCNSIYPDHPNRFNLTFRHQICTFSPGKSTCKGDSGGPLFWYDPNLNRYLLVGLTSFGPYAKKGNPGCTGIAGFTDISVYTDWIQDKVEYENENYCHE